MCLQDFGEESVGQTHLEGLAVDGRFIMKRMFWRCDGEALTGLMTLSVGTGFGLL
jgi:hypothetical protein